MTRKAPFLATLLLLPAYSLPLPVAGEPSSTETVRAQWMILAMEPGAHPVPLSIQGRVECSGSSCFVVVMHYSQHQAEERFWSWSGTGGHVAASAAWTPEVHLEFGGDGTPPPIHVDLQYVESTTVYGSHHVVVIFAEQAGTFNVSLGDWSIVRDFRHGETGLNIRYAWQCAAGASLSASAHVGGLFHEDTVVENGFVGFFEPADVPDFGLQNAAAFHRPNGDSAWCVPIGAYALVGVHVRTCPGWNIRGGPGRYGFDVLARANTELFWDHDIWLAWVDEVAPLT